MRIMGKSKAEHLHTSHPLVALDNFKNYSPSPGARHLPCFVKDSSGACGSVHGDGCDF